MYAPERCCDRDVLLACFDAARRIALIRPEAPGDGQRLSLPATERRTGEPYRRAAVRLARTMTPAGVLRLGRVTGRIPAAAQCAPARRRAERRLFTAHVSSPDVLHAPWDGTQLAWLPHGDAAAQLAHLAIADLDLFLQGYLQGWIPDGWITLG
ncbi:hypothetical protein [Streptomyces sp. SID12501]|uniref:NUDIX hydrolase n=1 Tax=Streptomyces sp. SID12501 TaxID=2706042 RepID=A0A6B3BQ04_9ACTN|nr:hypothetical protein [Streptomyces sp. SID12501]NEC86412.1 hypothetical protein [Streptomyces sp. SID12501]